MTRAVHSTLGLGLTALLAVQPCSGGDLQDLHFGEALYYAHQGQYLEALERLDAELGQYRDLDEPQLDSLHFHVGEAQFSVGDFELNYRMHHRAGRAIKAVLEGAVDEAVRNEAAFRLARIHFQKDQLEEALHALDRIQGRIPESIRDEVEFLRANVYLASGRPADAANVLQRLQGADGLTGFAEYNLGIALLHDQRADAALEQLDKAGKIQAQDDAVKAIKDKSNLILGDLLFESNRFERAQLSFDRVRLEGPFSNQALLRSGWAAMSAEQYDRAIVPWTALVERDVTDGAVQEALLALPYAYGKLNVNGRAALMYGRALETFSAEGARVDASIRSIREGKFLKALVREEIRQDKDWVIRLRSLPESPETYYLATLMASHDFQTALQNYLDLEDVRKKLETWQRSFAAFEDIIERRRKNYEPLLPEVDAKFRELDSQIRLRQEQRNNIEKRLHGMLTAPRPDHLATADERIVRERLNEIERALESMPEASIEHERRRLERLQGVLTWQLNTQYHERLTEAYEHLEQLNADIAKMRSQYQAFVRARQAAMHSYVGYSAPITRLRRRVGESLQQVTLVMARQGRVLEMVAINELGIRRDRLESYESQARYAVADSYDRATRAQANAGGQQ
ncbi:tetratricopeptide repeat protein [Peristeroidobacter agariperforans]|uniref:tetratricopeptide repeat protein n=1 Tax=Peristeroidobacter agariperforans TaxID=268404 RepID=UPI00101C9C65|nr:tetratricopeptide repeat protein [Peristeroidobacter agariperforans]